MSEAFADPRLFDSRFINWPALCRRHAVVVIEVLERDLKKVDWDAKSAVWYEWSCRIKKFIGILLQTKTACAKMFQVWLDHAPRCWRSSSAQHEQPKSAPSTTSSASSSSASSAATAADAAPATLSERNEPLWSRDSVPLLTSSWGRIVRHCKKAVWKYFLEYNISIFDLLFGRRLLFDELSSLLDVSGRSR